jgi:hypothetical protein
MISPSYVRFAQYLRPEKEEIGRRSGVTYCLHVLCKVRYLYPAKPGIHYFVSTIAMSLQGGEVIRLLKAS